MKIEFEVNDYQADSGLQVNWVDGYKILVTIRVDEVRVAGNREGLLTLAAHIATLAQTAVPAGCHLHYEADWGLEDGSADLILERIE